ncbi:MAG: D-glycero-beta-D-manno-heptose 1,7-bisphosphate 7-phosphatase [Thermoplasmata archaeon]|nr:MAG: D-glycero-beta-D-manno-heptose 1,7-bisphosphate 7-phosphatase [Thermoplasmata archaeon]
MTNRAVFLDRDGTVNEEVSYLSTVEQLTILHGAAEAIRLLNEHGFKVIIITNQSGVARGYFSKETLKAINEHLRAELKKEGAVIDAVYYCPHHPDDGCGCRKPMTGNIERAEREHDLDLAKSYMIGDTIRDMETGYNAGMKTVLVRTGYGNDEEKKLSGISFAPDFIARDLLEAVLWILHGKA